MPKRFYASWAFMVALAIAMPIAFAYIIWPPYEGISHYWLDSDEEMFGYHARTQILGSHLVPGSAEATSIPQLASSANECGPIAVPLHDPDKVFTAIVKLRGPYGIPFAKYQVTCSGWSSKETNGAGLGVLALLGTVALVSTPFVTLRLRGKSSQRIHSNPDGQPLP